MPWQTKHTPPRQTPRHQYMARHAKTTQQTRQRATWAATRQANTYRRTAPGTTTNATKKNFQVSLALLREQELPTSIVSVSYPVRGRHMRRQ